MEVMSTKVPELEPSASVDDAAAEMVEMGAGCIFVCDEGRPVGIVTERDIVRKVVAARRKPSKVKLYEIMTSPVVWVPRHMDIIEAAKEMAKMKLRRLAVMHDGEIVGVITVQNILRIAPQLIDITRELADINGEYDGARQITSVGQASGYCELCKAFSEALVYIDGELLCPMCKERKE
jgi:CBS domain-containing protein